MIEIKDFVLEWKEDIRNFIKENHVNLKLAIVQVGNNSASNTYVKGKIKDCLEVGMDYSHIQLPETISQIDFDKKIKEINEDSSVNGIIVQLPLPKTLKLNLDLISDEKDVDGFKPSSKFTPCTPLGIMTFLEKNEINIEGKNCVVIGRSDIVGKPMANLLMNKNGTVTICHSKSKNIEQFTKHADIIIVATGHRHTLTKDMIDKNNPIIIDVGINRNEEGKLCGDCDYYDLVEKCSYISPVPGGVGLLTRCALLQNMINTMS